MQIDQFLFQLAIIFLPGVIWARLDARWAQAVRPNTVEFVTRAFIFGLMTYAVTFLIYSLLGFQLQIIDLANPFTLSRSIAAEVAVATAVAFVLGILWLYIINRKLMARFLQWIGATKRYGDEDVWDFTFNSSDPGVLYVHLRDFEQRVVYAGYVGIFSETDKLRELVLTDVEVHDFEGNHMYDVPRLYLAREPAGIHIEFPFRP